MLRMRPTGIRAWRHAGQPHHSHQPLDSFAVGLMPRLPQNNPHPAASVKRVLRIFFVDQTTQQQIVFINFFGFLPCIERGTGYASQQALSSDWHFICLVNPGLSYHERLIPDFFFSQSSSTFSLPISLYSSSGSRCAAIGFGPRLPSKSVLACS